MWLHTYTLSPVGTLNSKTGKESRRGFFIRDSDYKLKANPLDTFLQFSEFIHWPELGDPEMNSLRAKLTIHTSEDLEFPFTLEENDLVSVKSNALITNMDKTLGLQLEQRQDDGFEVIKFKMGKDFKAEHAALMKVNLKSLLVRIDFNNAFNYKDAGEALSMLKKIPNLEYAEDPTKYTDYHWSNLEKIVPLGLDQFDIDLEATPKHFQFAILKPLRGFSLDQLVQWTYQKKKVVITNMMDNVIGTWKAYFYYCELKKHIPHHLSTPGFFTHNQYHDYSFQNYLGFQGAKWTYDKSQLSKLIVELNKLNWTDLNLLDPKTLDSVVREQES